MNLRRGILNGLVLEALGAGFVLALVEGRYVLAAVAAVAGVAEVCA